MSDGVMPGMPVGSGTGCLAPGHVKRDELISRMLQDRNALRMITAPRGFGKTELAREYAARLFSPGDVRWVDASCPDFLLGLDGEDASTLFEGLSSKLVILDGLPWLHEQRAHTLSRCIDAALYAGVEVIATTLPSCDCLDVLQPDRLCVHAADLLVMEQECAPGQMREQDGDGRMFAKKRWRDAGGILFGRVASVIWGVDAQARQDCLVGLFAEKLPLDVLRAMFAMLLLESGTVRDLEAVGITLRTEDLALLVRDYPVFGLDAASGGFSVATFELADLRRAVLANKLESSMLEGDEALSERILGVLFKSGKLRRGSDVIDTFCSDARCATWLEERGWDFLDSGELGLVSKLLDRCPDQVYVASGVIQSLHAWLAGFSGDRHEACHIARRVISSSRHAARPDVATIASRIALALFDDDAITSTDKITLSSKDDPQSPLDFLASVIDICTNVELARAFALESSGDDLRYEKSRRAPGRQRARNLTMAFTQHFDRFGDSRAFRLALHLLAHVDDAGLRRLVQELGCDSVLKMRRCGVSSFSEAILVRDLWRTGYFGLVGPVMDRRDARVLDGASHMLGVLASYCGRSDAQVPWEVHGVKDGDSTRQHQPNVITTGADDLYVRLFGGFEVVVGDRHLNEGKWRKKARALFALLTINHGRDVPRDDIFTQIWPGSSRTHALDCFYTVWANCVSMVGEAPYLERNGEYCRIDPRFVRSDVAEFEQLTRHLLMADHDPKYLLDTYAKIEALYRGPLFPSERGVRLINAQRDRYRALYVDAMVAASECALRMADLRIALWFARKALEEDQGREDVYRALMKAQIASGQRCPAIKTYLACRDYLQSTLGLDPSLETRELYSSLVTTDPELLRLESTLAANSPLRSSS